MSDKSVREALEKPFPPEAIKTRPSAHGPLSYVETWRYIQRLNEAYGGAWSFEIISHEIQQDEVLVTAKLITPDCAKCAFGSATIARHKETNEIVDLGDTMKAAASDSLKKACSLLGVGLHLWADGAMDQPADKAANSNGEAKPAPASGNGQAAAPSNGNGSGHSDGNGNGEDKSRLSSKQLGLILSLCRERGINRDALQTMVFERYSRKLEFLSRSEASFFIGELQAA
jgi:hypothetical protein